MKLSFTRRGGLLALLGGAISLIGFWLLPFSRDPRAGDFRSGLNVLGDYGVLIHLQSAHLGFTRMVPDPTLVSDASLWALLILFPLLCLLSLLSVLKKTSGNVVPLLCVVLSLITISCLFLAVYRDTNGSAFRNDTRNEVQKLLEDAFSFVAFGWWMSAAGMFLTLGANLVVFLRKGKHLLTPM